MNLSQRNFSCPPTLLCTKENSNQIKLRRHTCIHKYDTCRHTRKKRNKSMQWSNKEKWS